MARLIARIFADYENCPFVPEEFPELDAPADFYGVKKGGQLWVLEDARSEADFALAGSIAVVPSFDPLIFELFKVYLAHEWRGKRISQSMLETALAYAKTRGAERVRLWTDTRFVEAHRFYEKSGFVRLAGVRALHDASDTFEFGYELRFADARAA
jgi:putative acetyltransferase